MPDLLIGMVGRSRARIQWQDYLFIECKPVDQKHPAGQAYCDAGLIRFVRGDYAWAMTEAMMIGYANSDEKPTDKIGPALDARKDKVLPIDVPRACPRSADKQSVAITKHRRSFSYPENGRQAPEITLRH